MSSPADNYDHKNKIAVPCVAALKPEYYSYVLDHCNESDAQRELREECLRLDHPVMMAAPDESQFLGWLCATMGAKRVIEVGVFRGVTTLAIAKYLPEDGLIRAMDVSAEFVEPGKAAWKKEGVDSKIDFVEGPAAASMQKLLDAGEQGSYDFVFIDANKDGYLEYYELALKLLRPGGVIAVDNTLMHGAVLDPAAVKKRNLQPLVDLNELIKKDTRVSAVMSVIADGVYFCRKL